MIKVSLISLGCAKNLVDSEIMVGHLHQAGMQVVPEAAQADVVIVNTCSFIDSSKEESIGHILEAHEQRGLRKRRQGQKLIVAGCMAQRFARELPGALPEVDAFIGLDQITQVAPIIEEIYARERGNDGRAGEFRHAALHLHSRLRHAALPAHAAPFRLREDRRGLQPSVHLLHHPADPRPAPQPHGGERGRRGARPGRRGRAGAEPHLAGHHFLRHGHLGAAAQPAHAGRFVPRRRAHHPAPRSSTPSRAISGSACSTPTRRTGATNSSAPSPSARRSPATWTCRCSTSATACSTPCSARRADDYIRDLLNRIRAGIPGIALRTTFIVGLSRRDRGRRRRALRLHPRDEIRAPRRVPLLAGGRHARRPRCPGRFRRRKRSGAGTA